MNISPAVSPLAGDSVGWLIQVSEQLQILKHAENN